MTFYFYDLETSGFNPKSSRIMQFAGQRTDMELNPLGQPDNIFIKMTPDVLPEPAAVLVHGITPQKTLTAGITEAEFCKFLTNQVATPNTVIVGYNNIRFDNEFIRFTLWRNFHDAYEWTYRDNCSTWDLLDVVRMTRALRPKGIKWPFGTNGKSSNRLEDLSAINKLEHIDVHDAASDVKASISVARLIKNKQPKIFEYLFSIRSKDKIRPLVTSGEPLIYTSGRYPDEFEKTTIAVMVAEKKEKNAAFMYDLRIDPDQVCKLSVAELIERWQDHRERQSYFPVKELKYNRAPAIAPLSVLDSSALERLKIQPKIINNHFEKLRSCNDFGEKVLAAAEAIWPHHQPTLLVDEQKVDTLLYDALIENEDRSKMAVVRAAKPDELPNLRLDFKDQRLKALLPLYIARNFPNTLSNQARQKWEDFRRRKLLEGGSPLADKFFDQLEELNKTPGLTTEKRHLLAELKAYGQSITNKL